MFHGFSHFLGLLHHFVLAKLAPSSIRVNCNVIAINDMSASAEWYFSRIGIPTMMRDLTDHGKNFILQ